MRALRERVADISLPALADGTVVLYVADRVDAACAGTWVLALHLDAGEVGRTIGAEDALRSTRDGRVPNVVVEALAHGPAVHHGAVGVLAAGVGVAGVLGRLNAVSTARRSTTRAGNPSRRNPSAVGLHCGPTAAVADLVS